MALFFSKRIAPGIRISASPRGMRAHLGPRAARVHVGGGKTGVSTGAGPFTYYESLGGTQTAPRSQPLKATSADAMAQEARALQAEFDRLSTLHQQPIAPPPTRTSVAAPALPAFAKLLATAEKQELRGVGLWDRDGRLAARQRARDVAEGWARDLMKIADRETSGRQAEVDRWFAALEANQAPVVRGSILDAFGRLGIKGIVVDVVGDEARLLVDVPALDVVPERKPAATAGGATTTAKMTKTERNEWHARVVAGSVLLAARQALASAPALAGVNAVARTPDGALVVAAHAARERVERVDCRADAWQVLTWLDPAVRSATKGSAKALKSLDLSDDPAFAWAIGAD